MTIPCPPDVVTNNRAIQTLFLGASVLSYNVNMGWGGQPSSLTVELLNDSMPGCSTDQDGNPVEPPPLFKKRNYPVNHFYDCIGNDCFIDEYGDIYRPNKNPAPRKKDYPGKLYFKYENGKLVSDYWYKADPGFFGDRTQISPEGQYIWNTWTSYDIIGTPVYFGYDRFFFGGIVQSWEKTLRDNKPIFTVNIESLDNILDNSWLILRDYGGSIFGKFREEPYGAPANFITDGIEYKGQISAGNIHNVFNIYGFLESFGVSSFGGAKLTDDGISYTSVLDALAVLTSCNDRTLLDQLNKRAFSPFGRILCKTAQENGTLVKPTKLNFGCIRPVIDSDSVPPAERSFFRLDLSELPRPSDGFKINADVISVMEFIRSLTSQTGKDFFTTLIPGVYNGEPINTIKIRVVDRNFQPAFNQIPKAINDLSLRGVQVKVNSIGQENNSGGANRLLYIGGKQERLYQAKNYRLSYKQASYVYNPSIDTIVNFYQPNSGKIKSPSYLSTRNLELANIVNGPVNTKAFSQSEVIHRKLNFTAGWEKADAAWVDTEVGGNSKEQTRCGNYLATKRLTGFAAEGPNDFRGTKNRYLPIFMDTICPFFGYVGDQDLDVSRSSGINSFRKIRPVWFDSWTGQIVVIVTVSELPEVTLGSSGIGRLKKLSTIFPGGTFLISETEIRAAMAGFDSYLTYCFAKNTSNKPQLFSMLASAYYLNNPLLSGTNGGWANSNSNRAAANWIPPGAAYQNQVNMSNMMGEPGRGRISTIHNINWDYFIDNNFVKDLMLLCNFIADIGNRYYGQKYMVRLGQITAYKDSSSKPLTHITSKTFGYDETLEDIFTNVISPKPQTDDSIAVFAGSGRIYFAEETCDSAWEEPGNVIDDTIVVGGEQWSALINDQGKIPAILGYNASDQYDYEALRLCILSQRSATNVGSQDASGAVRSYFAANPITVRDYGLSDFNKIAYANWANAVQGLTSRSVSRYRHTAADFIRSNLVFIGQACDETKLICPSINTASLNSNDYVLTYTAAGRLDAFGKNITPGIPSETFIPPILNPDLSLTPITNPYGMSKKIYVKANSEEIAFLDILNLRQPRAIVSCGGVKLAPASLTFSIDPTRTVLCNAALEDLIVYLKSTPSNSPTYSKDYVNALLFQIRGYDVWSEYPLTFNASGPSTSIRGSVPPVLYPNGSYNNNVSNNHAMLVEKAAHPFFAGVPIKSNQFTYGPWTNYPALYASSIFVPGLRSQLANYQSELQLIQRKINQTNSDIAEKKKEFSKLQIPLPLQNSYLKPFYESLAYLKQQLKALRDLITKALVGIDKYSGPNPEALENMIGGVKVEINSDLVPWNYGGSAYLDQAVLFLLNSNSDYQNILESAQITINSSPIFGIGSEFLITPPNHNASFYWNSEPYREKIEPYIYNDVKQSTNNDPLQGIPIVGNPVYLPSTTTSETIVKLSYPVLIYENLNRVGTAPIITNMSVRFDSSGFNTTYSFKTYARKIGLYSKEAADRLKRQATENIATNRLLFGLKNNINNRSDTARQRAPETQGGWSSDQLSTKLFGNSPNEVLVGSAEGFLPSPQAIRSFLRQNHQVVLQNGAETQFVNRGNDTTWRLGSFDPGDLNADSIKDKYRHRAWVGLFEHWETKKELEEGYEQKSAMSLDGIFSPVSFYPTPGNTTYPLIGYPRLLCPACAGAGKITDTFNNATKEYACPLCSKGAPSYLYNENASGVNALNLQPVVVPYPPFRNFHAQPVVSGERQKHSIRVVGRNSLPPFANNNSVSIDTERNKEIRINPSTNKIVEDGNGFNPDFFIADIARAHIDGNVVLNNHRFFALRGPLMMHGWGYDTSGFPVPNAADEPKEYDGNGRPKRFLKTEFGTNDYRSEGAFTLDAAPNGLGDIIGKGWVQEGGEWIRKPMTSFHLNWAERPDLWPVGPIDLRWDHNKGVWVGGGKGCTGNDLPPYIIASGNDPNLLLQFSSLPKTECSYKMVYVVLEEDLIKEEYSDETFAVRGFLDDIEYSTAALPNNVRRLVFIKDRVGYTAPRGAKLLCRYDGQYGFYEPISKQSYFVFGIVRSGNNATVDLEYIQGKHRGSRVPTINIRFINRFGFDITSGSRGMFYFENGRWILVAVKSAKFVVATTSGDSSGGGDGTTIGGP